MLAGQARALLPRAGTVQSILADVEARQLGSTLARPYEGCHHRHHLCMCNQARASAATVKAAYIPLPSEVIKESHQNIEDTLRMMSQERWLYVQGAIFRV